MTQTRLLGDIGATHARFAVLLPDGGIGQTKILRVSGYETINQAIAAYLAGLPGVLPEDAALGIAGPVTGDRVAMTNADWHFSRAAVQHAFGWKRLFVVNDFHANALAIPHLTRDHLMQIGEGAPAPDAAIAVLGPGTGLGVAGLVPSKAGWTAIPGEGGNVTLAAMDSHEEAIVEILHRQSAHVSAEHVLSGPGLVNLYDALCELAGKPAAPLTPDHVTDLYPGCDPQCREAVAMFCAMLGTFAGDVALTFGARGGIYIMGGIVPKILEFFRHSAFRERFEAKGRYRAYVASIPTLVVTHKAPAFLGLATLFD